MGSREKPNAVKEMAILNCSLVSGHDHYDTQSKKKALPQNQWVGFGVKSGFMRQITVVSSALIGVETRERFQRALSVCRWQRQSRRSGSAKWGRPNYLEVRRSVPTVSPKELF